VLMFRGKDQPPAKGDQPTGLVVTVPQKVKETPAGQQTVETAVPGN
jgi:hypothetical protein